MSLTPMEQSTLLWKKGLEKQLKGDFDLAYNLYLESINVHETAEAHTFLGWCIANQSEDYEKAIRECKLAITIDPSLGNPYNDIGAYLVELDRSNEADAWFQKAKQATRYENPQFPFLNLARLYTSRGEYGKALLELQAAEVLAPHDKMVGTLINRIKEKFKEEVLDVRN